MYFNLLPDWSTPRLVTSEGETSSIGEINDCNQRRCYNHLFVIMGLVDNIQDSYSEINDFNDKHKQI